MVFVAAPAPSEEAEGDGAFVCDGTGFAGGTLEGDAAVSGATTLELLAEVEVMEELEVEVTDDELEELLGAELGDDGDDDWSVGWLAGAEGADKPAVGKSLNGSTCVLRMVVPGRMRLSTTVVRLSRRPPSS